MAEQETEETTEETTGSQETEGATEETGREPDWKAESRKHERRAKQTAKELEQERAKLKEREQADQTEHEKAIAAARDEAAAEERTKAQAERRSDRLEVAVTRAAAKTFADTDDALLHIQRAINAGDVDPDDIFDDEGKVQTSALTKALDELLERKPHLKAGPGRPSGDADAGKGSPAGGDDRETPIGVEERLKRKQGRS